MAEGKTNAHAGEHGGEHDHGIGRYLAVWAALIVGTITTVVTGRMDFGGANIFIAMAIAIVKATLVILFFMHLWYDPGMNRLIMAVSVLFALVMMLGIFGDLVFRLPSALPNNGPLPADYLKNLPGGGEAHE